MTLMLQQKLVQLELSPYWLSVIADLGDWPSGHQENNF